MNRFLLLFFSFIVFHQTNAQIQHHGRFESDFDWKNESPMVISNEEQGLLMVETFFASAGKEYSILLSQLDTAFNKSWQDTVKVNREFQLLGYHYTNQKTYLMLQNWPAQTKVKILEISNAEKKVIAYETKDLLEIQIEEFEMVQNTAVIGGYFDGKPVVLAFDLSNDKLRTLPNVYQNKSKLIEVKVNNDGLTFNVLVSQVNAGRDRTIIVNTYDYQGNPVRDYELITKPEFDLITGVSSSINDISQVVVGLYGFKSEVNPSGVFVNHVNRVGEQEMQYYSFGELNHFFDYLGVKKAEKYKKRALEAKKSVKEIRYRLHPLLTEMIEDDDHYVFFGEFIKGYNYVEDVNNRYRDLNRYNSLNGPGTFDPLAMNRANSDFEFSHAFALVLNKDGKILWDDWAKLDKDMNGTPINIGEFQWTGENGTYLYYSQEEARGKFFNSEGSNELLIDELTLKSDKDELRYEDESSLRTVKWYGKYFLIQGVQTIKSRGDQVQQNKIFFINKISIGDGKMAKEND